MPHSAVSDHGLHCLPMSLLKKGAMFVLQVASQISDLTSVDCNSGVMRLNPN